MVTVHNFSYGLLNPALGYAMSFIGSFLGLRCVILARAYQGAARARWLVLAAVAIGAVGHLGDALHRHARLYHPRTSSSCTTCP